MQSSLVALAFVALIACAAVPSALGLPNRHLLQNPQCQTYAQGLATDCAQFLGTVQSSMNLNGASDAQLMAAIGNNKPSPTCCGDIQKVLSNGCRCDANVEALAQGLGIQPSGFFTLGRAGVLACGLPSNTDSAPNPCPPANTGGK
ncbi:g4069 [Coccomyxa viridis]|uniref:G4069 protein n=1 Tax=Coccomyxa viridis TaxID=1274662 RepID=A0ABP1FPB9_9CHLO